MTDDDWIAWAENHRTMFYLRTPEDAAMVGSWRPLLDQYARAELDAASLTLLKDPPSYRDKHVSGLLRILEGKRAERSRAFASQSEADEDPKLQCGICRGTAFAYVPHPKCMVDGEFLPGPQGRKMMSAVTCSCHRGLRKASTYTGEKRPLTLGEYERKYGTGWGLLMAEWMDEQRKFHGVTAHAREVDAKLGPILQRMANRMGLNRQE